MLKYLGALLIYLIRLLFFSFHFHFLLKRKFFLVSLIEVVMYICRPLDSCSSWIVGGFARRSNTLGYEDPVSFGLD